MCADISLSGEESSIISHAIYELLFRFRRSINEYGTIYSEEKPEIRVDLENNGKIWSPTIEMLSQEEHDKRDGDRDREICRIRRETARFRTPTSGVLLDKIEHRRCRRSLSLQGRGNRSESPLPTSTPHATLSYAMPLTNFERSRFYCQSCAIRRHNTPFIWRGPNGNKTLCHICGLSWVKHAKVSRY
jgi:chromatin structure-remodeling complex subunit SFH1